MKQAIKEDLRARSAYKFKEIQDKHKLIRAPDQFVIDLGAAPGGWSVVAAQSLHLLDGEEEEQGNDKGLLIAIDLLPIMSAIPGAHIITCDFNSASVSQRIEELSNGRRADLIMSDMLHNTTGHKDTDHFRSMDLCFNALV